ncbi:unnamed protein product [Didymodactylos carnosus]|uniref:Uncharacterized protein n=1 Tax=Didymodactylos carnosus TaxID=1234261 RepID=A0A814PWV0_9BILA|nr:unnamed protein product [Didymodactylos carnosus]CAF1582394.1 unnamed protein product [Didymodactylos carnosus]CAF3875999.1 unnamed protein product [Didymodactylos carnosus]CAF4382386.1 unnamed protein product [Didymodactylos carnosus]
MGFTIALFDPFRSYEHELKNYPDTLITQFHSRSEFLLYLYYSPLKIMDEKMSFIMTEQLAEAQVPKLQHYITTNNLDPVDVYVYTPKNTGTTTENNAKNIRETFIQKSLHECEIVREMFHENELMEKLRRMVDNITQ